jgi:hypothetical protein
LEKPLNTTGQLRGVKTMKMMKSLFVGAAMMVAAVTLATPAMAGIEL